MARLAASTELCDLRSWPYSCCSALWWLSTFCARSRIDWAALWSPTPSCSFKSVASAMSCSACPRNRWRELVTQLSAPLARPPSCFSWAAITFCWRWTSVDACSYSSNVALLMLSFALARSRERDSAATSLRPSCKTEAHWLRRSSTRRSVSIRCRSWSRLRLAERAPSLRALVSATELEDTNCLMSRKALVDGSAVPSSSAASASDFTKSSMSRIALRSANSPSEPPADKSCPNSP
mmetsp:Transcript_75028/g.219806  ORF Transcript_75028/g.219806 Transcript_75028/m.219806 type:complete len:237 (-) Transcript_75028:1207-1917(-)